MLYVIKNNKLFAKVSGNYNLEDYKMPDTKLIEHDDEGLIYNNLTGKLEEPIKSKEVILTNRFVPIKQPTFFELIKGHSLWDKILSDGEKSLKLNLAVTLLINVVMSKNYTNRDFTDALTRYLTSLKTTSNARYLTQSQLNTLQNFIDLSSYEFDLDKLN